MRKRKSKSKLDTVKDLAQIYTTLKLTQVGPRAARKAAKGYAGVKAARADGRGLRKVVGIALAPIAIGGLVAFLRKRNQEPPGYQPVSSPSPSTAASGPVSGPGETRFDKTPPMGEPAAPKSGTTSASPEEPADAPAGDAAERS